MIDLDIVHATEKAVSLVETRWEYTGGAHGNSLIAGRNFVSSNGEVLQLKLDDLFDPASDWSYRMIKHCVLDLRSQGASHIPETPIDGVDDGGLLLIDDLASFTMSPDGFRIYFGPYHVGSYAEGIYTVQIPYDIIRDCLTADSPARSFFNADGT